MTTKLPLPAVPSPRPTAPAPFPAASPSPPAGSWTLSQLAGRLSEISSDGSGGCLSPASRLLVEAQLRGEAAAWVTRPGVCFFPADMEACGVDLAALAVIRVPDAASAGRAADKLLRSGAFGLVIVDLGRNGRIPVPLQSRLLGLASRHGAALLFLTEKAHGAPSLGPLVSLRVEATRKRTGEAGFDCGLRVLKDKLRGPLWSQRELRHGPPGLR